MEAGLLSLVADDVFRIGNAAVDSGIAYVYGISARFLELGAIDDLRGVLVFLLREVHPHRAVGKGILSHLVVARVPGEALARRVHPRGFARCLLIIGSIGGAVVVYDDLFGLPVALTWGEDIGSGVLKHGNEVGHDDGLGEQVLGGAEQIRPLPFPHSLVVVVVAAMRRPHHKMPVEESVRRVAWGGDVCHPWQAVVVGGAPRPLVACSVDGQLFDERAVGSDSYLVVVVGVGERLPYFLVNLLYIFFCELLLREVLVHGDVDRGFAVVDGQLLHLCRLEQFSLIGLVSVEIGTKPSFRLLLEGGALGADGCGGHQQACNQKRVSYYLAIVSLESHYRLVFPLSESPASQMPVTKFSGFLPLKLW